MTSYQRATKLAAAPIGAGIVITSRFFGEKTSNQFSSAATTTLRRQKIPYCTTYARTTNHPTVPPRLNNTILSHGPHHRRPLSTTVKPESSSSSSSSSSPTKPPTSPSIVQWYESHLEKNPVATKMVTGSFLWGLGDFVAQIIPTIMHRGDDDEKDNTGSSTTPTTAENTPSTAIAKKDSKAASFAYDYQRTARAVLFGFALHAPLSHVHFNFLEWMTIRGGFAGLSIPIFKTVMEQFVYWSWISNSLYHVSMGAMQGMTTTQITDRLSNVLMDTQKAQWVFWIPVQLVNFRFVPVRHQLNVVLTISVVWTALMSTWYPPEEEGEVDGGGGKDNVVFPTDGVVEVRVEERSSAKTL